MILYFGKLVLFLQHYLISKSGSETITTTLELEMEFLCYHILFFKQHIEYFTQKTSHYLLQIFT